MTFDRITRDPGRLNGEPCIRDLRLTVRRVVETVALYPDRTESHREYPEIEDDDVRQALEYAAAMLDDQTLPLKSASWRLLDQGLPRWATMPDGMGA